MIKKRIVFIFICLVLCSICSSFVAIAESYSEILVNVTQVAKINIYRSNTSKIDWWGCDRGKIILLAGNTIEIYNENTGDLLKTYILSTEYQGVQISENGSIFLRSKDDSHILIIENDDYKQILIPDHLKIWSMYLMKGMPIFDLYSGEASILRKNGLWEKYPSIHYVGRDDFAYFYEHGTLYKYNEKGVLVEKYETYFDPDPGYSLGIDEKGIWFLIAEPFIDKREGIDTLQFIYLDPKNQYYGYFILPFGVYHLGQGCIYRLEDQSKLINLEEIIDDIWNPNLITITKWKIDGVILY